MKKYVSSSVALFGKFFFVSGKLVAIVSMGLVYIYLHFVDFYGK